jgi:two-component system cell cycle response regulator
MKNNLSKLDSILENMEVLNKLYDIVRVVDPVKKEIIKYYNPKSLTVNENCYATWNTGKVCENCISVRAYIENQTLTKIEYNQKNIYMVTSTPIQLVEGTYVIELLKDISESGFIKDFKNQDVITISSLIQGLNSAIVTDELTNLYNRRFINERLPVDMARSLLLAKSTSLVMCDIDFFKLVNDNYGHIAGDYVLQEFSACLKKFTRSETDWVSRYGGEEFLICLNNTDNATAIKIIEKIRVEVENMEINYNEDKIKITASFGICTISNKTVSMNEFIELADKNLYEAKKTGRNKTIAN